VLYFFSWITSGVEDFNRKIDSLMNTHQEFERVQFSLILNRFSHPCCSGWSCFHYINES